MRLQLVLVIHLVQTYGCVQTMIENTEHMQASQSFVPPPKSFFKVV